MIINNNRTPVWRIHGSADVNRIEFGGSNRGLLEIIKPESLTNGHIYGVSISAGDEVIAYAGSYFCFSNTGSVIQFVSLNEVPPKCEFQ